MYFWLQTVTITGQKQREEEGNQNSKWTEETIVKERIWTSNRGLETCYVFYNWSWYCIVKSGGRKQLSLWLEKVYDIRHSLLDHIQSVVSWYCILRNQFESAYLCAFNLNIPFPSEKMANVKSRTDVENKYKMVSQAPELLRSSYCSAFIVLKICI